MSSNLFVEFFNFFFRDFWKRVAVFGRDEYYFFVVFFLLAFGYSFVSFKMFLGFFFSYIIVFFIRAKFYRERPNKRIYNNFFEKVNASSFPSMHSVRVSLLFTFIVMNFSSHFLWGIFIVIFYLVCIGRIILKRHHVSDVVVGVIIGILISLFVEFFMLGKGF